MRGGYPTERQQRKIGTWALLTFQGLKDFDIQTIYGKNAGDLVSLLTGTLSSIFLLTQVRDFDTLAGPTTPWP